MRYHEGHNILSLKKKKSILYTLPEEWWNIIHHVVLSLVVNFQKLVKVHCCCFLRAVLLFLGLQVHKRILRQLQGQQVVIGPLANCT